MPSAKTPADNSIGRVPPHNNDAEVALLGSILLKNRVLDEVQTLVTGDDFYQTGHKAIWNGIIGLKTDKPSVSVDIMSLTQYMSQKGTLADAGGAAYIASLTDSVPTTTNASYYAEIIRENSLKRTLFDLSAKISDAVFDESKGSQQVLEAVEKQMSKLNNRGGANDYFDIAQLLARVVDEVHDRAAGKTTIGVSSGFKTLDKYIGGFKPSELIIIAARPSVGKTALALSIAVNMAFGHHPVPIGFFSLEMSGASLIERVLSNRGQVNLASLRNGKMDADTNNRMMTTAANLYDNAKNLLIQDTPNMNLLDIKSQARRMVKDNGVKAIFIDYIGLIEYKDPDQKGSGAQARHEQVSIISRSLKQLARELEVPIICLCQVNREGGKDRPPMLADLRDSGSIEQDADLVMLLDDPSKRLDENGKISQYEDEEGGESFEPVVKARPIKIIIAKQRNGSTGAFNLNFVSDFVQFKEIEKF
ncbi:MAG: replicative DNA helicase [Sphaerochaetaceae bacterium]|nr:replicative DNA helicase [Sphaerochaetaceae bacterium]